MTTRPFIRNRTLLPSLLGAAALIACGGGSDATSATSTTVGTGTGTGTGPGTTTVSTSAGSTAAVLCGIGGSEFNSSASVKQTATYSWTCSASARALAANGLPNHEVGTFPNANNPNTITPSTVSASYTLTPTVAGASTAVGVVGYALNGVKFDPSTAGSCDDSGTSCSLIGNSGNWRIEALGQSAFNFGVDGSNAHVQPTGEYHYHGMPEAYLAKLGKGAAMTLVGWASDGFPIYARYDHSVATDAASALKVLSSSYRFKAAPDANRPSTRLYAMGTFAQDYEYVAGSGDLDECNGRTGVTPEFPAGTYHYLVTDTYPFIQRCVKGTAAAGGRP